MNGDSKIWGIDWLKIALVISVTCLLLQLAAHRIVNHNERPRAGRQTGGCIHVVDSSSAVSNVRYLISLPRDYPGGKSWPLLLFLHGSGQRGNDLRLVSHCGPPYFLAKGQQLPFVVVSPQCDDNAYWRPEILLGLLDELEASFAVAHDRVIVCGYSMGAYGVWGLVSEAPDRFAAAIPVAGGGDMANVDRLLNIPIWAFHGARDDVVPIEESRNIVDAIRVKGGEARLTVLESEDHGICNLVFSRDDLYEWLLQQRRSTR